MEQINILTILCLMISVLYVILIIFGILLYRTTKEIVKYVPRKIRKIDLNKLAIQAQQAKKIKVNSNVVYKADSKP